MFVVNGNISLGTGGNGTSIGLTTSTQPNYDIVSATLIADDFIWADNNPIGTGFKNEGLYIRGSAVTTGYFEWNRDLLTVANAYHPALIIQNDPIYHSLFKSDLWLKDYSIREQQ